MSNKLEQLNDNTRVEVMKKAQSFNEMLDIYKECIEENGLEDELLDDLSEVLDRYIYDWEDTENENRRNVVEKSTCV